MEMAAKKSRMPAGRSRSPEGGRSLLSLNLPSSLEKPSSMPPNQHTQEHQAWPRARVKASHKNPRERGPHSGHEPLFKARYWL